MIIYDDSTILDNITINGRISKKLFEKVITPKLKELEARNKELEELLRKALEDDLIYGHKVIGIEWIKEAKKLLGKNE
jgi:hypothetical protein